MGRIEKLTLYSLVLLLVWGNMVSGLGAGLACPDWPLCFGTFFPEINFPILMEHGHRLLGLFVTISFAFLVKKRLKFYKGGYKLIPILCSILLAVQIIAGGLVVILQLETNITTFHFGNAIVIFILIYTMCIYIDSDKLKLANVFDFIGQTSIEEFQALSKLSLGYVGMDTLNMHIAAAQNKPIFAIFGPTVLKTWSPWSNDLQLSATNNIPLQTYGKITIFQADMKCVACGQAGCNGEGKSLCLDQISPKLIFNEINDWYQNAEF